MSCFAEYERKYRCEYAYRKQFGNPTHQWSIVGAGGGMHLHITDMGEEHEEKYGTSRYSGGIEIHWRYPPEYMRNDPPSHDSCWLLKCPCWHDGSSIQASEVWIPVWLSDQDNHERMFEKLAADMDQRFSEIGGGPFCGEMVASVMKAAKGGNGDT